MKTTKQTEPHWQQLVELYFEFCKNKFGAPPSLDGSALMALKHLLKELKKRSETENFEWTLDCAKQTFGTFLEVAISDPWLAQNFFLRTLNSQKDKIFFKIASNGYKSITSVGNAKSGTSNSRMDALRNW
jgi:hypothetical protein